MKRISIKLKVTILYSVFMVLITITVFAIVLFGSVEIVESEARKQLVQAVEDCAEEIEYDSNELDLDDDIEFYDDGIYISIYDGNKERLEGIYPSNLEFPLKFQNQTISIQEEGRYKYYLYDIHMKFSEEDIWIRGVTMADSQGAAFYFIRKIAIVLFPLLILLVSGGGYYVTKRAFLPVVQITNTAKMISDSKDLSKRIQMEKGSDEISKLASTFDDMLDKLEQAFEAEKQFTDDASHELRTPIAVILSQSEYAMEHAQTLEESKETLEVIHNQAVKMSAMISQLLTLARADKGTAKIQFEEINVSDLAEMVAMEEELEAAKKKIRIITDIEENIIMEADQMLLTRLFINLISNGIKYGNEGGYIKVRLKRNEDKIYGSVEDNGIGIGKEHIDKIWERFYQVDSSRTSGEEGGSGLGLSMVKWIVEVHGGGIEVKSKLGEGSSFQFFLLKNVKKNEIF